MRNTNYLNRDQNSNFISGQEFYFDHKIPLISDVLKKSHLEGRGVRFVKILLVVSLVAFTAMLVPALATNYYISATGNNLNDGSMNAPWRTIGKVNGQSFQPGDHVYFEGGSTFLGTIHLNMDDQGTSENPIVISSYGSGKATIQSPTMFDDGIYISNTSGIVIQSLIISGQGSAYRKGISVFTNKTNSERLDYILIQNNEIFGFNEGVKIVATPSDGSATGYDNVSIVNNIIHDVFHAAVLIQGAFPAPLGQYSHSNVYIANNELFNVNGDPQASKGTGNGLAISQTDGVTIERNTISNGGNNNERCIGPSGVWIWESNNALIQFNEIYNWSLGANGAGCDGNAVNLDGGVSNTLVQYNYSHDNDGAAFQVRNFNVERPIQNCVVRYNVSENDAQANKGAVHLSNFPGADFDGVNIYNNTFYLGANSGTGVSTDSYSANLLNTYICNNIFYLNNSNPIINVDRNNLIHFLGNSYFNAQGNHDYNYLGTTYEGLEAFRNDAQQENLNGVNLGYEEDPMLRNPGNEGAVNDPYSLNSIVGYELKNESALVNGGLDLNFEMGISIGVIDYFGNINNINEVPDVGAHENQALCSLVGEACDDKDRCTVNDVYDVNCNCEGSFADFDADGVCDADDICEGGDDNQDTDGDGIPDFCDDPEILNICDNNLIQPDGGFESGELTGWSDISNFNIGFGGASGDHTAFISEETGMGTYEILDQFIYGDTYSLEFHTHLDGPASNAYVGVQYFDLVGNQIDEELIQIEESIDFTMTQFDLTLPMIGRGMIKVYVAKTSGSATLFVDDICIQLGNRPGCALAGANCNDLDNCTTNDTYDSNCNCSGSYTDMDNDGVCDAEDVCEGGDDNVDTDGDGIPDFCDDPIIQITCENNLLMNGDFESGELTGWTNHTNMSVVTGGSSGDFTALISGETGGGYYQIADQFINGDEYTFGLYTQVMGAVNSAWVGVQYLDINGNQIDEEVVEVFAGTEFELTEIDLSLPMIGRGALRIWVWKSGGTGQMYVDDVCLRRTNRAGCMLVGKSCDDNDACTENDLYDQNCNCAGEFADADNDNVCDAEDICPGGNDNEDEDGDGIPDFCDEPVVVLTCANNLIAHNPGFETGDLTGWDNYGNMGVSSGGTTGEFNCYVGGVSGGGVQLVSDAFLSGDSYALAVQALLIGDVEGAWVGVQYLDLDGVQIAQEAISIESSADYIQYDMNLGVPEVPTGFLRVFIWKTGENGTLFIDDLCLTLTARDGCSLVGKSCNDGNLCTEGDVYDANCECYGTYNDSDTDGICDAYDICPGFDDNLDSDEDGIPDGCDENNLPITCENNVLAHNSGFEMGTLSGWDASEESTVTGGGTSGDFTVALSGENAFISQDIAAEFVNGDVYALSLYALAIGSSDYAKAGVKYYDLDGEMVAEQYVDISEGAEYALLEMDLNLPIIGRGFMTVTVIKGAGQGIVFVDDVCLQLLSSTACNVIGMSCDDKDECTINDTFDKNCNCIGIFVDSDSDGVCDASDLCPGFDDTMDIDADGIPDGCDVIDILITCDDNIVETNPGFETGTLEGWDGSSNAGVSGGGTSGDYAASIGGSAGYISHIISDEFENGDVYNLSFYALAVGSSEYAKAGVQYYDLNGNMVAEQYVDITEGAEYEKLELSLNLPIIGRGNMKLVVKKGEGNGVVFVDDVCLQLEYTDACSIVGWTCDDKDPCTVNDMYDEDCNCKGTFQDTDKDGVCDAWDICQGGDDNVDENENGIPDACDGPGTLCENNLVTVNADFEIGDLTGWNNTQNLSITNNSNNGDFALSIEKGLEGEGHYDGIIIYDILDEYTLEFHGKITGSTSGAFVGVRYFDENMNVVQDQTIQIINNGNHEPFSMMLDATDLAIKYVTVLVLKNSTKGSLIVDDVCLSNNSTRTCTLEGKPCNDNDECTTDDAYDDNCDCVGTLLDQDNDTVCDLYDVCPNGDDRIDSDGDGIPDDCEVDPCSVFDFQSFEINYGFWNSGGHDSSRSIWFPNTGKYSWVIRDNSETAILYTDNLAFAQYESLEINYFFNAQGYRSDEEFFVEISTDGGESFIQLQELTYESDFVNNVAQASSVNVKGLQLTNETVIRFRSNAATNYGKIYLDDIEIIACATQSKQLAVKSETNEDIGQKDSKKVQERNDERISLATKVYPNPAIDLVYVELMSNEDADFTIRLMDQLGRVIEEKNIENEKESIQQVQFEVSELESGIYFVHFESAQQRNIKKLIVN